jgi:hypothetical protein
LATVIVSILYNSSCIHTILGCFNERTLLKFEKLGNDNAYGTLIECLAGHVKRIELDDEFAAQLRDQEFCYDFVKIKSQSRSDMFCKLLQELIEMRL